MNQIEISLDDFDVECPMSNENQNRLRIVKLDGFVMMGSSECKSEFRSKFIFKTEVTQMTTMDFKALKYMQETGKPLHVVEPPKNWERDILVLIPGYIHYDGRGNPLETGWGYRFAK